jgi:membrane-associated phospholipid phosphatase
MKIKDSDLCATSNAWIELRSIFDAPKGQRVPHAWMLLSCWWNDVRWLMRGGWRIAKANSKTIALAALGTICLLCFTIPQESGWLAAIRHNGPSVEHGWVRELARLLSYWGDFAGFNMLVFGTLCVFAFIRRSPFFRRLTIAAVLGTILTGGTANVLRMTTGRARPGSGLAPGFYGPRLSAKKQSFPSAHTATSFGASVPVAVAFPPLGVPMLLVSGGVAWSRMENNRHHPSDVAVSILLASLFGIPLGLMIRRRQRMRGSVL